MRIFNYNVLFGGGGSLKAFKRQGFTLAEVLITLGIIGIVAAMTIPGLITKYQKQATAIQLKKIFSTLNQVMLRIADDPGLDVLAQKPSISIPQYVQPYFAGSTYFPPNSDLTKILCYNPDKNYAAGKPGKGGTAITQYTAINKNGGDNSYISSPFIAKTTASIMLPDGSCIGFNQLVNPPSYKTANIFVDINGSHVPPNRLGRDMFWFYVDQDKYTVVPTEKIGNYDFEKLNVGAKKIKDAGWTIPKDYPWK
ncbi:type II secretion system protein [bacterium]|nr:type II secretion system protein [bacterium]